MVPQEGFEPLGSDVRNYLFSKAKSDTRAARNIARLGQKLGRELYPRELDNVGLIYHSGDGR